MRTRRFATGPAAVGMGRSGGFTLIELMIVVVIIAIISAMAIPAFVGRQEKASQKTAAGKVADEPSDAAQNREQEPHTVKPVTVSADINIRLTSSNYLRRLQVYTIYDADLDGAYTFRNNAAPTSLVKLDFPFPEGTRQAGNVSLMFKDDKGSYFEPKGVEYSLKGIKWIGTFPAKGPLEARVTYGAQGRDRFSYEGPGTGRAGSFRLDLALNGATTEYIPADALQPSTVLPGHMTWGFANLVTDRRIVVELPGAMSPIGRLILLSKLAGLAVLLFGAGFMYLSDLRKPGMLDEFRWGHFLLLALNYFMFFVVFMVLSISGEIGTFWAIVLSAGCSMPLLMIHVQRIVDKDFAYQRVLPLAIYTLGMVIAGAYGAPYRKYLFIVFIVMAVAFVTLTFGTWTGRVRAARQERKREAERRAEALPSCHNEERAASANMASPDRCCIACGVASPASRFCPECGVKKPLALKCADCGEVMCLPVHIIELNAIGMLHCGACGRVLDTGV